MTRILLLTAALIAAFTVNAFAADNEVGVTLTIEDYVTVETAGAASHNVIASDYPAEPGEPNTTVNIESTATVSFSANSAFEINTTTTGQFGTTVLEVSVQDGTGFVAADGSGGEAFAGGASNNTTKDIDFRITGVNGASLPQTAAGTKTVTFTISAV